MKLLMLAAGRGTRISKHLDNIPKCTVDINGKPLIKYTVDLFKKNGITDISIVVGYEGDQIREVLKNDDVTFYDNPFYDVTNSIASVWFAQDFMHGDDMLIMNADVFLEQSTLDIILCEQKSPVLFADSSRKEEGDYLFYYEDELLIKYGKELTGNDITGEYVGIAKLDEDFMDVFLKKMNKLIQSQKHNLWWENILYEMIPNENIYVKEVTGNFWAEVDYLDDYERILDFVNESNILKK